MSDYLSNLAARSLNLAEVIPPRRSSLFEPYPISRAAPGLSEARGFERRSGRMALDENVASEKHLVGAEQSRLQSNHISKISRLHDNSRRSPVPSTDIPQAMEHQAAVEDNWKILHPFADLLSVNPPMQKTEQDRRAFQTPDQGEMHQSLPASDTSLAPDMGQYEPVQISSGIQGGVDQSHRPDRELRPSRNIQKAGKAEKKIKDVTPASDEIRMWDISADRRATYPEGAFHKASPLHAKAAAKPEPSIKVTIGRIEVRAITKSEEPVKRSAQKIPALSLDDYLRLRNGGAL